MAYINWTQDYDLGIEEIDRQHRRLVEIVNRLHDAMEQGCPKGATQGVVCDLVTYLEIHFTYEERLMQRLDFPDQVAHKGEHRLVTREAQEFEAALASGGLNVSMELMGTLKTWLQDHVVRADRAYADLARAQRDTGAQALRW